MMVLAGLLVSNNKGDGHHYDTDSGNCPYSKMFIEEQNSQYYSGKRLKREEKPKEHDEIMA